MVTWATVNWATVVTAAAAVDAYVQGWLGSGHAWLLLLVTSRHSLRRHPPPALHN